MPSSQQFLDACDRMLVSSDGKMLKNLLNDDLLSNNEFEFTVRAHIIEAREVQEAKRTTYLTKVDDVKISPVVRVSWIKEKDGAFEVLMVNHTKIRNDTHNPTYDQLIVFKKLLTPKDFYFHTKIKFEILDASSWEREKILSTYEFNIFGDIIDHTSEVATRLYSPDTAEK